MVLRKKNICLFDLEGPISTLDFAAELGKILSKKPSLNLQNYDMAAFFRMISNYDDYLIDVAGVKEKLNILDYQPGDTLRLLAPLYVACYSDNELITLAKSNLGLLPGCKKLMSVLHKMWDIYVISTSYSHFAYNVTSALGIPRDHVYCTHMNIKELKEGLTTVESSVDILIKEIFQKYLDNNKNLDSVIEDLNIFFWKGKESDYINVMNKVEVRGGKRKEIAVEEISRRTHTEISEMIALGDSITDIDMLKRLKDDGGIAVSFNGNRYSVERSTIAVSTTNSLGVLPIFQAKDEITHFLTEWEDKFDSFQNNPRNIINGLISKECKEFFIKYNFLPEIVNLTDKSREQLKHITLRQEKMRKIVRGWAGILS